MAATTSAFASLQAPPHDDTMDMSSPARRHDDEDIDIDIDFTYNEDTLVVDDQMLDDEQTRPHTATDTAMDEDAEQDTTLVQEEDMMDDRGLETVDEAVIDAPIEEDDELIDYGEDDYPVDEHLQDAAPEELVAGSGVVDQQHQAEIEQQVDYESPRQVEDADAGANTAEAATDQPHDDVAENASYQPDDEQVLLAQDVPSDEQHILDRGDNERKDGSVAVSEPFSDGAVGEASQPEDEQSHVDETIVNEPASAAYIETHTRRASDVPPSPTDTGLHHMILQFGDTEIPLFRSQQSPEGLLTNDNLVGHHLADLISNCKERLQETESAVFSEHEECMLQFQGLPLLLLESSKAAYNCTLNDVLDVYLLLHHNAGTYPVPPLFLTLSVPETFTDVLESLKMAAESGQGIPNVQYSEENIDDDPYVGETGGEQEANDGSYDHTQEQYPAGDDGDSEVDQGEDAQFEGDHDDFAGEHEPEESSGTYQPDGEDTEQREEIDDNAEGQGITHEEPPASSPGVALGHELSDVSATVHGEEVNIEGVPEDKATSPGSSATAQDEQEEIVAGEYEDDFDLIDWDDDESLIHNSADATNDADIESAPDAAANEQTSDDGQRDTSIASHVQDDGFEEPDAAHDVLQSDVEEEFEDEIEALDEHEYHLGADDRVEDYGETHESAGQQTDIHDEQQHEYPLRSEEEQYHTARDFLNGQTDQHGPETGFAEAEGSNNGPSQSEVGPMAAAENYDDPNEVIDFDDDTPAEHEARKGSPTVTGVVTSDSPLGKRSFDEHADEDLYDDDEPELKKARSR